MEYLDKNVERINLNQIMQRVQANIGMEESMLKKAEDLYKAYLTLRLKYPEAVIVPPKLADYVWHEHIMSTKQYEEDCNSIFGKYLHHNPSTDKDLLQRGWDTTLELFKKEFHIDLLKGLHIASDCS